ncbi:MAG: DUF5615 family PIN-like protein [Pseudomonadales bacterium]|nr:DUF5615 family PIN-like protein [Pseudomonadales bacterium]
MKLLIDMNLSPRWVSTLSEHGFTAVHWTALGAANAPDKEILAFAKGHDYTVLTHDLDFGTILAATGDTSPSVIQIRAENTSPRAIAAQVISAIRQTSQDLQRGALLTIDPKRTRIQVLPLRG